MIGPSFWSQDTDGKTALMKQLDFEHKQDGTFQTLTWNAAKTHDSCWALHVGSDDNVYISSCSEGLASSAHLLRYDPEEQRLWDLLDVGELSGDLWNSGRVPQSKIHTSLRETSDGYLYGISHCTAPAHSQELFEVNGSYGDPEYGFLGAQLFRVRIADGRTEHLGVAIPYEGCRSMEVIESTGKVYMVSYPRHILFEYDLSQHRSRMLGRIGTVGGIEIFSDTRGRIYGSYDDGRFFRYWPDEERFEDLSIRVPGIRTRRSPYNFFFNVKKFRPDFVCGNGYYDGHLFRYDPEAGGEGKMEDLGPGWNGQWPGLFWASPYVQAPVLCDDRWLYYGCNPIWEATHLMRKDLVTGQRTDLGVISPNGLATAWLSEGGVSRDGKTLYFADVNMKGTVRMIIVDVSNGLAEQSGGGTCQ